MPRLSYKQGVWIAGKTQPNGYIEAIDWEGEIVHVRHYDTNELTEVDFHQFDYFRERLNQWIIRDPLP